MRPDEPVAVIDSEKTTFDLPAPRASILTKILYQVGDTVKIGESVAQIEADGEAEKSRPEKAVEKPVAKVADKLKIDVPKQDEKTEAGEKLVEESEPEQKTEAPASKSSAGLEEETIPMTMLRRTVAKHLVEAQQTMAMLTTFNEVDMSVVQSLRKEHREKFERRYHVKLGLMSFF